MPFVLKYQSVSVIRGGSNMKIPREWDLTPKEQKKLEEIIQLYGNDILSITDLTGPEKPSKLFYTLAPFFHYLLDTDPKSDKFHEFMRDQNTDMGIKIRRAINPVFKKIGPKFLGAEQKFIDKETLEVLDDPNDRKLGLSNDPVIYCCNHAFKDDILASVLAAEKHAYLMFASLPQFFNTLDGITAWLNGVALMNRRVKESKKMGFDKSVDLLERGTSLIVFPEGVWNKTPNLLMLEAWKGAIELSKMTGAKIIPMLHHIDDPTYNSENNSIYTLTDNPFSFNGLSTDAAKELLRDTMASKYYLMLEKYAQAKRDDIVGAFATSEEAWDDQLQKRIATADRYDPNIETCADYRDKRIIRPEDVFEPIADAILTKENCGHVEYAKKLVKQARHSDFQRRY